MQFPVCNCSYYVIKGHYLKLKVFVLKISTVYIKKDIYSLKVKVVVKWND